MKYIGEQALWAPIGEKYFTVFINVPLRIYYQGTSDTLSSRNIAGLKMLTLLTRPAGWAAKLKYSKK